MHFSMPTTRYDMRAPYHCIFQTNKIRSWQAVTKKNDSTALLRFLTRSLPERARTNEWCLSSGNRQKEGMKNKRQLLGLND